MDNTFIESENMHRNYHQNVNIIEKAVLPLVMMCGLSIVSKVSVSGERTNISGTDRWPEPFLLPFSPSIVDGWYVFKVSLVLPSTESKIS